MLPIIISAIESPEDRELTTGFYETYNAAMYREARKHLENPEDVEDIVYEALAKIIDKMEIFRELKPLQQLQYAITTVRNLSYILLKRNNHFTFIPIKTACNVNNCHSALYNSQNIGHNILCFI